MTVSLRMKWLLWSLFTSAVFIGSLALLIFGSEDHQVPGGFFGVISGSFLWAVSVKALLKRFIRPGSGRYWLRAFMSFVPGIVTGLLVLLDTLEADGLWFSFMVLLAVGCFTASLSLRDLEGDTSIESGKTSSTV